MNRENFVATELVQEMDRLRACKGQLDILIRIVTSLPPGEDREAGLDHVRKVCDSLETEAKNLQAWHQAFREVPDVH